MSLTRSGIPRFIPPQYRKMLRQGNPDVIRIILSVCALSRLLKVTPRGLSRISPATIHQVNYQPGEPCKAWCKKILCTFFSVLAAYAPAYKKIPLDLGFFF